MSTKIIENINLQGKGKNRTSGGKKEKVPNSSHVRSADPQDIGIGSNSQSSYVV